VKLCSVQPFSLAGPGGGPRILSSLFADAPVDVLSVCTAPAPHRIDGAKAEEAQLPSRPQFGRLERTRLNRHLGLAAVANRGRFARRLRRSVVREGITAMHAVAHSGDFAAAHRVASELGLPFFLSVHDDPYYTLMGRPEARSALSALKDAWRDAEQRFVISEQMGDVMNQRFGERPYLIVTDGLTEIAGDPRPGGSGPTTGYFMGAFHISYIPNLEAFVRGAAIWGEGAADAARIVMRSGPLPLPADLDTRVPVEFREWAPAPVIGQDLEEVDFLYLPLPFGEKHEEFVRYSLSTKLVTYVGSGLPILYHGPREAAACRLLEDAGAAALVTSLDPSKLAAGIARAVAEREELATAALELAHERFDLERIRHRFWAAIDSTTSQGFEAPSVPTASGAGMP
jgi:hypothetical protein